MISELPPQVFRSIKAPSDPPIDLKKLHAKIGEQALEIDFLEGVLKKLAASQLQKLIQSLTSRFQHETS